MKRLLAAIAAALLAVGMWLVGRSRWVRGREEERRHREALRRELGRQFADAETQARDAAVDAMADREREKARDTLDVGNDVIRERLTRGRR